MFYEKAYLCAKHTTMARNILIDEEKAINSALYILRALGGTTDYHKLFKILYFADQKHLVRYGTPFSGDIYVAMKHGPVPTYTYDIIKWVRDMPTGVGRKYEMFFSTTASADNIPTVSALSAPDTDVLSSSNIECLEESIHENRNLDFGTLTRKSHGSAWEAAKEQTDEMEFVNIASDGGADPEMLEYIELNLENKNILTNAIF